MAEGYRVIGLRLKLLRVRAGFTQAELAQLAGLDEEGGNSRISQYEREVSQPDFKLVCLIAKVFDVPEAYFYAADDELAELILRYHEYKKTHPGPLLLSSVLQK